MRQKSKKTARDRKRLDPTIVVAFIGLAGTIVAALLASPLLDRLFPEQPSQVASTRETSSTIASTPVPGDKQIGINQTVTGTLYGAEAGTWIFSEGPARVTMILDVGPFGSALIARRILSQRPNNPASQNYREILLKIGMSREPVR